MLLIEFSYLSSWLFLVLMCWPERVFPWRPVFFEHISEKKATFNYPSHSSHKCPTHISQECLISILYVCAKRFSHQCASQCWCSPTRHTTFATSVIVYITLCIVLSRQALQQHRWKVVRGVTQNCGNTWWPLWLTVERPPLLHKWG